MSTREVLVKARALVAEEDDWVPHYGNVDTGPWCAHNALCHVNRKKRDPVSYLAALNGLAGVMGCYPGGAEIGEWNDSHTHAEVLAAFDRAIAGCES